MDLTRINFSDLAEELGVEGVGRPGPQGGQGGGPGGPQGGPGGPQGGPPAGGPQGGPPAGGPQGGPPAGGPQGGPPAGGPQGGPPAGGPQGGPGGPGGPGGAPGGHGGGMTHPNVWRTEGGRKALDWLKAHYAPGDRFEYDGHADCWLMLAIMYELKECDIQAWMGGPFGRCLDMQPYRTEGTAPEHQPCTFTVVEQGDDVQITVHLDPDEGPFSVPFSEIVAPAVPEGKNIYVRLDGRHLLFLFPLALTYGDTCRSIITDYSDECFVSVSHTPDLAVGDLVENPF